MNILRFACGGKLREACRKRMRENLAGRGRRYGHGPQHAWWVERSPARPRYCWRMAELCEAEMEADCQAHAIDRGG